MTQAMSVYISKDFLGLSDSDLILFELATTEVCD